MKKRRIVFIQFIFIFLLPLNISYISNSNDNNKKILRGNFINNKIVTNFKNSDLLIDLDDFSYYKNNDEIIIDPIETYSNYSNIKVYNASIKHNYNSEWYISNNNKTYLIECDIPKNTYEQIKNKAYEIDENIKRKISISYNNFVNIERKKKKQASYQEYDSTTSNFAKYTSTDTVLDSYKVLQKDPYDRYGRYLIDDITKIIPLDCFINNGIYTYIGDEYGFYIETTENPVFKYRCKSSVIVFDIEKSKPNLIGNSKIDQITYNIIFKINYCFNTLVRSRTDKTTWINQHGHPDLEYAIYPDTSSISNIMISDLVTSFQLLNLESANPGDTNYNQLNDNGDYFYLSQNDYKATFKKIGAKTGVDYDIFKFFLTILKFFVNKEGKVMIDQANLTLDIIEKILNNKVDYISSTGAIPINSNNNFAQTYEVDYKMQIKKYGGLVKNIILKPEYNISDSSNNYVLYGKHEENEHFSVLLNVYYAKHSEISEKMRLNTMISFNAVRDNTYKSAFTGKLKGTIDKINDYTVQRKVFDYKKQDYTL